MAFLAIFCIGAPMRFTPSLRGGGFHIRRTHRRRHLVQHGRVLVLVADHSISSVLLSVRVSIFVLFCSLGFLACGVVRLDHLAHIVGIVVLLLVLLVECPVCNLLNFCCVLRLFFAATSVVVSTAC